MTNRPPDPPGAARHVNRFTGGWWQDNIDATVYLARTVTAAQRRALRERLESLPEVDSVAHESAREALARFRMAYRDVPEMGEIRAEHLPESFRLRLRGPGAMSRLRARLCGPKAGTNPENGSTQPCGGAVEILVDQRANLFPALSGRTWAGRIDATIFFEPGGTSQDQIVRRQRVQVDLMARGAAAVVAYESREAATERVRALFSPTMLELMRPEGPAGMPASLRLRVSDWRAFEALRQGYCQNPTGWHDICKDGVLLIVDQAWLEGRA